MADDALGIREGLICGHNLWIGSVVHDSVARLQLLFLLILGMQVLSDTDRRANGVTAQKDIRGVYIPLGINLLRVELKQVPAAKLRLGLGQAVASGLDISVDAEVGHRQVFWLGNLVEAGRVLVPSS